MGFYELPKSERNHFVQVMRARILTGVEEGDSGPFQQYAADSDTYIRKNAYTALGLAFRDLFELREVILRQLESLEQDADSFVRQTVVYALGEIGRIDADCITAQLERALADPTPPVRAAVVGALKRIGEKNPQPALAFARKFLHHKDPTIRRQVIHGIELRGRTHPEDVLPILQDAQQDPSVKVRSMIIHVLAQVSYKEGCLETVLAALKEWENSSLVEKALQEIMAVYGRYAKFSAISPAEAEQAIRTNFPDLFP